MSEKSEQKQTALQTVSINLFEYDKLKEQISSKQKEIDNLNERIGDYKRTISEKSKDERIKCIQIDEFGEETVTYQNLSNLEKEAYEKAKKEVEKELAERKKLEYEIADLKLKAKEAERDYSANLSDLHHNNRNIRQEIRSEFTDKLDRKDDKIKSLEQELVKVKNDKTDEQLEKARKKEISQLNKIIAQQSKQIEELQNRSWFRRVFERIVNFKAQIAIQKDLQKEREKLAELRNEINNLGNTPYTWSRGAYRQSFPF